MRYNNYHKHTHYSNLRTQDSICKPKEYIERAKELGHTTYFTTEHGYQGNIFEAYTLCQEAGLKCIYAVEAYYTDDIAVQDRIAYHIMLVAMTENARREINRIISTANTDGFYYKPRIDLNMLLSLPRNEVVVTTACIAGRMFKEDWNEKFFLPVKLWFGDNFYLEVQSHVNERQAEYNKKIMEIHYQTGVKIIHANDSHYIHPEDSKYRDFYIKAKGISYDDEEGFCLDYPDSNEILRRYALQGVLTEDKAREALSNTLIFDGAEGITIDKNFKIPKIIESSEDSNERLKTLILEGWVKERTKIDKSLWPKYAEQINYEYNIVKACGMADYFILDHYIVDRAVNHYNAILTRSGRGSAVSFYINKLLGLTEVDRISAPITLYPTRFMSSERILSSRSLPDIDLNFADVKPVIRASKDYLGEDGIYYMVAYKQLQEASAFRLWCKAIGMNISEYDDVAKDWELYIDDSNWGKVIEDSKIFRGVIESVAPSPCSFLLSNDKISEIVGLIRVGNEICCCLDGYNCDVYKYLKNDYLTVQVYSIIDNVYKLIGKPIDDIKTLISNCDDDVWKLYSDGYTTTINQADSDFDKQILTKYKPKNLAEMSAYVAAIRPGFASLLDNFVNRRPYTTGVEDLDKILEDSFHYMMYQESIMKYLVWLGIEEKGTYDIIKKIAKKKFKEDELNELKKKLSQGWINKVGKIDGFEATWQVVMDAAHYSFNASHSLSVAIDSLYGAYLKSHYPLEYFTVALTQYSGDGVRTDNLTAELAHWNIKLQSPVFRHSKGDYWFDKETNTIYKGILSIKGVSKCTGDELYSMREREFANWIEFLYALKAETHLNKSDIDILIRINFFAEFGNINALLYAVNIFDKLWKCKTIKVDKLTELGLDGLDMSIYSAKQTEKTISDIDNQSLIMAKLKRDSKLKLIPRTNSIDIIKGQLEYLGYTNYKDTAYSANDWYVIDIKKNKYGTAFVSLYNICYGVQREYRLNRKYAASHAISNGDIITAVLWDVPKRKKVDDKWIETGEKITEIKCWKAT